MLAYLIIWITFLLWLFGPPFFYYLAFPQDNSVNQLFNMLDTASLRTSSIDMVRWSLTATGIFIVKSYFLHLSSLVGNTSSTFSDCSFPWNIISKSWAPLKVSFFVSEACLRKILSFGNLQKGVKILVNICFLCENVLDTMDHLLLHYPIPGNL